MTDNLTVKDAAGASRTLRSTDIDSVHKPHHFSDGSRKAWRDNFTSSSLATNWASTTGSGTTVSAGSNSITITTGGTAGGYCELLSTETFSMPCRVVVAAATGTRRTNIHYMVELVSVNSTTGAIDNLNAITWSFGGIISTTNTLARYEVTNGGLNPTLSSNSTIVSTNTVSLLELEASPTRARWASREVGSQTRAYEYVNDLVAPNPSALYKLRVRSLNAAAFKNVTGAVAGTGNVIRLTVTSHGYSTSDSVWVEYLAGATNNGTAVRGWYTITSVDSNTIELQGTTFAGTYATGSGRVAKAMAPTSATLTLSFIAVHDHTIMPTEVAYSRGSTHEAHLGEVGGNLVTVSNTPTVSASPAYTPGDVMGGVQTISTVLRASAKTGYVTYVEIISKAALTSPIDIFIFNATPSGSTTTDNAAFALAAADMSKMCGHTRIDTWRGCGGNYVSGFSECRIPLHGMTGQDFFAVMVVRGAETLGSTTDLVVKFTSDNN